MKRTFYGLMDRVSCQLPNYLIAVLTHPFNALAADVLLSSFVYTLSTVHSPASEWSVCRVWSVCPANHAGYTECLLGQPTQIPPLHSNHADREPVSQAIFKVSAICFKLSYTLTAVNILVFGLHD